MNWYSLVFGSILYYQLLKKMQIVLGFKTRELFIVAVNYSDISANHIKEELKQNI